MNKTTRIQQWWHRWLGLFRNLRIYQELLHPCRHSLKRDTTPNNIGAVPAVISTTVNKLTPLKPTFQEVGVIHCYHGSSYGLTFYDSHGVTSREVING